MTRRRAVSSIVLILVAVLISGAGSSPAAARWNIHNDADVTQITAPPGGSEDQTCADRLRGENGWSAFVDPADDPSALVPPPQAYGPGHYSVWQAPPGFSDFVAAEVQTDDQGEVTGYLFPDGSQATRLPDIVTADRAALPQPIRIEGTDIYVYTTAPIDVALPPSVDPGDVVGLLPPGGSEILDLTVIDCTFTARGMDISVVKHRRFTRTVATFTGPGDTGDYTASIRWGDGTNRSVGTIGIGSNGQFRVTGSHTYRYAGCYSIRVRITQRATGDVDRVLSRATVRAKAN